MQTSDVSIASKSLPLIQTKKTSKTVSEYQAKKTKKSSNIKQTNQLIYVHKKN